MDPGSREKLDRPAVRRISRARFILPDERIEELAQQFLHAPSSPPKGKEEDGGDIDIESFSKAIETDLLKIFTATEELKTAWQKSLPIALGSWARSELSPKSDLDLLFAGDESAAAEITMMAQEAGIKIRGRVPESKDDWTIGVEAFDVLALLYARPLTNEASVALAAQLAKLKVRLKGLRRGYFAALKSERRARSERFDSITNFLEPNLKYGPGGLRDMGQAYQLRRLFPERFQSEERGHALAVFEYYKKFFLLARIRMQLSEGGGDLLSAHEQAAVASWFGFESGRDFMREIQRGLSRVAFYADVDFETVKVSEKSLERYTPKQTSFSQLHSMSFTELAAWLEKEPTVLVQAKARELGFKLFRAAGRKSETEKWRAHEALRKILVKSIDPLQSDDVTIALFRSRWIDLAVTDFKKIVGYVQHDQYHRYTVDAHLMQAIREMKRVAKRPTLLGRLAPIAKGMSKEDWKILGWTALYHDVGKGSGGDHSDKSVVIAKHDLAKWGVSEESCSEIIWLIENHLELSTAAFRGNPAHPSTWRMLHGKGIEGKRLSRLAIFTAVDIRATNREAYTAWKERLLHELVKYLELPEARQLSKLEKALGPKVDRAVLDRIDPFLVSALPTSALAGDLKEVALAMKTPGGDALFSVRALKLAKQNRVWIRFHTKTDRTGLFAQMARALQSAGLSVRHASILSDEAIGVYDWFEVKPPRSMKGLETKIDRALLLNATADSAAGRLTASIFDDIECLSKGDAEWVISFRGRDSRGALLRAAEALADEGLSILWAKVHTWGRQIDDVFGVSPLTGQTTDVLVRNLKGRVSRR